MLNVLYAGSPFASRITLEKLHENSSKCGFKIAGVLSNPESAKGRSKELTPTPVSEFAIQNKIPLFTPEHLDSNARKAVSAVHADILVCFAYGHIFGPKFLSLFKYGGINLHPSLLPKYRGCTPVNAAILNRDSQTAITVQTIAEKMDEGLLLSQEIVNLNGTETAESLLKYAAESGSELISIILEQISSEGEFPKGMPQIGKPSYTNVITKQDAKINWNEDAKFIEAKIRAYYPEPACWCEENVKNQKQSLKILKAKFIDENDEKILEYRNEKCGKVVFYDKNEGIFVKCKKGILVVTELQRQGKKNTSHKDFMNGARDFVGTILE